MAKGVHISPRTVTEIKELMIDLRKFDLEAGKEARRAFNALAKVIAEDAKGRAKVKTGAMQKATKARVTSRGDAMIVNSNDAARMNEFGGRHPVFGDMDDWVNQEQAPFMFPAVAAHRDQFYRDAETVLDTIGKRIGFL